MGQVRSTVFLTFSNFFALHLTSSRSSVETSEGFIEQVSLARYTMIKVLITVQGKYTWNIKYFLGGIEGGTWWKSLHYLKVCSLSPKFLGKCECIDLAQPKCCMHLWTALILLVVMMMVEIAMVNIEIILSYLLTCFLSVITSGCVKKKMKANYKVRKMLAFQRLRF